ncbi:PQQ-dependent sugar dehydrogenase [Paenibacillus sedimenti]|uniref:PQQ-dependent sugar dehydrogenase n=1 Tax=Paenibacillus sedimenti TaxID=2770274 RepID=A0A926KQ33_9BACL|nr:PQQ-dependent sugar dehydrogenase [Paenibacillus sedimenti]MBD0380856.1 PQQ-dependent sugar dehydrogenase [Paenibacillus sedimenti]
MRKIAVVLISVLLGITTGCTSKNAVNSPAPAPAATTKSDIPYTMETIAEGLNVPWEMDIAKDGRIFFTERPGHLRVIEKGRLNPEPLITFEAPFISTGEGGLLGLALDPSFMDNHYIYVYHTYRDKDQIKNRVLRLIESNNKARLDKVLIAGLPGAENHNGGRIKIGPDMLLYITSGDRYDPPLAQDLNSTGGKILRIGLDGSIPASNPFKNSPVYSLGHRNPQGLAWHPETGQLYSSEHGQTAHDEINLIEPGGNYGWPLIEGEESSSPEKANLKTPLLHSGKETWAPSGAAFVRIGPWKGSLLVAGLRGERLIKLNLKGPKYDSVASVEHLFQGIFGRLRNVYEGPDGSLYIMTNNRDGRGKPKQGDDKIIRLKPNF